MHGYQHFIDHQMLVDEIPDPAGNPKGPWSKPAYLLSLILTELTKDPEERLDWLL
ncbi:hypothetical protein C8R43DRAFT_1004404 [Mycena crocata]|nr:hypothetical protein C8R43DRAFT_1004404 [Mycena crocata]